MSDPGNVMWHALTSSSGHTGNDRVEPMRWTDALIVIGIVVAIVAFVWVVADITMPSAAAPIPVSEFPAWGVIMSPNQSDLKLDGKGVPGLKGKTIVLPTNTGAGDILILRKHWNKGR